MSHTRQVFLWAMAAFLVLPGTALAGNTISTIVGSGGAGYGGDAGPGPNAAMNAPRGIAQLTDGSILIADSGNNRIRKLSPSGIVTTVAGTGTAGALGDGGLATAAQLSAPRDVAVAPDGVSYYIADGANNRIRAVAADGTISRILGTGVASSIGDGTAGNLATVNGPSGLGIDSSGNLYIADTGGNRIRRMPASLGIVSGTSVVTTVAGTGTVGATGDGAAAISATLNAPQDVMWSGGANFLIADSGNHAIRGVVSGTINRVAGNGSICPVATNVCGEGGQATLASLNAPGAISSDGAGGYLISDSGIHRLRQVKADGTITTIAGSGTACSTTNRCGDGGTAELAQLNAPRGAIVGADSNIYIADTGSNRLRVRIVDPGGTGPAGPAGPAGPTGPTGPAGNDGSTGPSGTPGATGPAGATGPGGAAGAAGVPGADGSDGANGLPGSPGLNGLSGRDGASGPQGVRGVAGAVGPKGDTATVLPLVVALPGAKVALKGSSHTILKLFLTDGAKVTLRVTRGSKAVRMRTVSFKRFGRKNVDLGRIKRGSYRLVVIAQDGEQTSVDRAVLVIR